MKKFITIEQGMLQYIIDCEARKLCGKCMKRFELTESLDFIKKEIKELIYESLRDVRDMIEINSKSEKAIYLEKKE